ncbi:hypothetical protein M2139_002514 [Enterococcus sp. PF1-24]|uniref:hypothetical protein n=1 Tax=unclassified Enterococcus TaxID=2608891 RepID=UPI002476777A|nr:MULTISPECIES: hypothetical protein [unclassified Enterococcus]MDH6365509.1 hypothetical protein [Enterococcus sp. PFB1-1]MDH6402610.1 hypothetical protein [Enterococcus sp. PF1-24]
MAAPIRLNNDYIRTYLVECQQMTHEMQTKGRSMSKNRQKQIKSYRNYQPVEEIK